MDGTTCLCPLPSPTLTGGQLSFLVRCVVSLRCGIIACGGVLVLWETRARASQIKSILKGLLRMPANLLRTRASAPDAETLRLHARVTQRPLHQTCSSLGFLAVVVDGRVLHAAGVWIHGADDESLMEMLFSGRVVRYMPLAVAAASSSWWPQISSFRILHVVFVVFSACQLWLSPDCVQRLTIAALFLSAKPLSLRCRLRPARTP